FYIWGVFMNWKRSFKWILTVLGLMLPVLIIAGIFILRSQRFHEFVLARIEQKAGEATGGKVTIQGYDFHWRNLSADIYGLMVRGREQAGSQPLLVVDRLFVDVRVVSVFKKKVDLNEIIIQHPVVRLISYPDGSTNIPKPTTPPEAKSTSIF